MLNHLNGEAASRREVRVEPLDFLSAPRGSYPREFTGPAMDPRSIQIFFQNDKGVASYFGGYFYPR